MPALRAVTFLLHAATFLMVAGAVSACAGARVPSTLDPHGPSAERIAELAWILFVTGAAVELLVAGALLVALFRRCRERAAPAGGRFSPVFWVVAGGVAMPAVMLVVLMGLSLRAMPVLYPPERPADVRVEVIGHQFWWEIVYPDYQFTTANEIHVPVGRPVAVKLMGADVIHSFWVPQLQGKLDLIPGKINTIWLQADRPGVYRGQCAEFCGIQHALMILYVIAEPPDAFQAWVAAQQQPAQVPQEPLAQRGAQVFAREGCITCHSIRYGPQPVGGTIGPDLTHLASRRTIGAGLLENTRGNLGGWIINSQALKPGNKMPPVPMDGESLQALLAYLESLK
jgi:cytochrome c oxidase subunit 2